MGKQSDYDIVKKKKKCAEPASNSTGVTKSSTQVKNV